MTIAILGTKGVPNAYGGFEAFAEHLSLELAARGHRVVVTQPAPIHGPTAWGKVERVALPAPQWLPRGLARLHYDYQSLRHCQRIAPQAMLRCGHSAALFYPLLPKGFVGRIVTCMDGLEWARPKWGWLAKGLLRITARLALRSASTLVVDSQAMVKHLAHRRAEPLTFIPYGANPPAASAAEGAGEHDVRRLLSRLRAERMGYGLAIARLEPENQIDWAAEAFARIRKTLLVVGCTCTPHGRKLAKRYAKSPWIRFCGPIYHAHTLSALRGNARVYYHGHTVGGTNPSLLEAMASGCLVLAHANEFNQEALGNAGLYFSTQAHLAARIEEAWDMRPDSRNQLARAAQGRAWEHYRWDRVTAQYIELFERVSGVSAPRP